ncbi:MAG: transcription termination factor Rho [Thermoflexaceae bacterium]|nr:transcription termination factor Rho [Thermoflexaceae bacterium]
MRAKLETLSLAVLRDFAKDKGIKNISAMKKSELIEAILSVCQEETQTEKAEMTGKVDKPEKIEKTEKTEKTERPEDTMAAGEKDEKQPISEEEKYKKRQEILEQNVVVDPVPASGILEVMPDGYGFIRCENFLPGDNDVYVSPSQIRKTGLKTGDILYGKKRVKSQGEKFAALLELTSVNGYDPEVIQTRPNFENLTPIFPNERIHLEKGNPTTAMRIVDLICPIGKGQRGMIVSQPKAGKTTLLKQIATAVLRSNPEMHMIILLIDERPEEVTDIKESIVGDNVEVIYSTFDELPERHKRVSEMVIERARRLVEHKKDVIILLDSITRLTRAYNVTVQASGRTLSGGLDPMALHMPKRFFGAARNMREGGSLTILATALIETGSKMDDVVFEEFKGTGNMELVLDRKLSEKRVFPAIDIAKSSTRRDDLLLTQEEMEAMEIIRKNLNGVKPDEATDRIIDTFARTKNNKEFIQYIKKTRLN